VLARVPSVHAIVPSNLALQPTRQVESCDDVAAARG
jgi:hypothetical protein